VSLSKNGMFEIHNDVNKG